MATTGNTLTIIPLAQSFVTISGIKLPAPPTHQAGFHSKSYFWKNQSAKQEPKAVIDRKLRDLNATLLTRSKAALSSTLLDMFGRYVERSE